MESLSPAAAAAAAAAKAALWELFSSAVEEMVEANERPQHCSSGMGTQSATTAHSCGTPASPSAGSVEVERYVRWVHSQIPECDPAAYAVAFVYIPRFLEKHEGSRGLPRFPVDSSSFRLLALLSIMIADKFLTQSAYSNAHYAAVGGMSTAEINKLEWGFLKALGFDLHVDSEDYLSCCAYLECTHRVVTNRRAAAAAEAEHQRQLLRLEI